MLGAEERIAVNSNQGGSTKADKQSLCLIQGYLFFYCGQKLGKNLTVHPELFSGYGRKGICEDGRSKKLSLVEMTKTQKEKTVTFFFF